MSSNGVAAIVAVSDDDVPEISIAAGSGCYGRHRRISHVDLRRQRPRTTLMSQSLSRIACYYVTTALRYCHDPVFRQQDLYRDDHGRQRRRARRVRHGVYQQWDKLHCVVIVQYSYCCNRRQRYLCSRPFRPMLVTIAEITGWRDALDPTRAARRHQEFQPRCGHTGVGYRRNPDDCSAGAGCLQLAREHSLGSHCSQARGHGADPSAIQRRPRPEISIAAGSADH